MSLVEWPERLGPDVTPQSRLEIQIELAGADATKVSIDDFDKLARVVRIVPFGASWTQRIGDIGIDHDHDE